MGIIISLISGKRGKLYFRLFVAAALLAVLLYSYSALAAVPSATPAIVNTNGATINSIQIANASLEGGAL